MKKGTFVSVLALLGVILGYAWWQYSQLRSAADRWDGPIGEILSEKLDKQDGVLTMEFTAQIDAPVAEVFRAFSEPERGREFSEAVHAATLLESEGNRKVVRLEVELLDRLQEMTLAFTFLPAERRVLIQTINNPMADLQGEYLFTPSPNGAHTLLTYSATATDKMNLPIPDAVQKSAAR